jgi:hypothetical protein
MQPRKNTFDVATTYRNWIITPDTIHTAPSPDIGGIHKSHKKCIHPYPHCPAPETDKSKVLHHST